MPILSGMKVVVEIQCRVAQAFDVSDEIAPDPEDLVFQAVPLTLKVSSYSREAAVTAVENALQELIDRRERRVL